MPKQILLVISLSVILITTIVVYKLNAPAYQYKPGSWAEADLAINQAYHFYQLKQQGEDLSSGPCLSNDLIPDWVADLVHDPRTEVDDLPENQCRAYLEGRASHFVELDIEGKLVRVQ